MNDCCHEMLRARLRLAGSSFSAIARELGITPSSVSLVSQGHRRSEKVERAIASKLQTQPEIIWPARYTKERKVKP
ncbi:helix-turn-helix domain-containing protein [Paracoccus cavernae]